MSSKNPVTRTRSRRNRIPSKTSACKGNQPENFEELIALFGESEPIRLIDSAMEKGESLPKNHRPLNIDDDSLLKVMELSSEGLGQGEIAASLNVGGSTFQQWLSSGRQIQKLLEEGLNPHEVAEELGKPIYHLSLLLKVLMVYSHGHSKTVRSALANIRQHGERDWRASAWYLERVEPQTFRQNKFELEHSGKNGNPIEFATDCKISPNSILDLAKRQAEIEVNEDYEPLN